MPSFCRHNRLVQNCPICAREQAVEMRPVVSSGAPRVSSPRPARNAGRGAGGPRQTKRAPAAHQGMRVRRLDRGADDGFSSALVPGLRSSADAARLADQIAFAATRLQILAVDPPGLYAEVAAPGDVEERAWLAFQIAVISPLDEGEDPFASIDAVRTSWASGELPDLDGAQAGARTAVRSGRARETFVAYRAWAQRAGSQAAAFTGERGWSPERRFDRVYERLALPGLHRDARYELLVLLGRLGVFELRGGRLHLGGADEPTLAAKRALGIGDPLLLERRAADLAAACEVPIEALDLALFNWGSGGHARGGLPESVAPDETVAERCRAALGL